MIHDRPIRVLESFQAPTGTTNPYIVMLYEALRATPGLETVAFSWRTALLGSFDVFHVHWPEVRLEGRSWAVRALRHVLMAILLAKLRMRRIPIVRTRHNVARPTGIPAATSLLLAWLERQTAHEIVLNATGEDPNDPRVTIIPHGHYRDWFAAHPKSPPTEGRFAYFGLVRNYKGLTALVEAFTDLPGPYSLTVAGNPSRDSLVEELRTAAGRDDRIVFDFRFLPDGDLVRVATEGRLVVLAYREMHNSGGVLAALSLDRPVLVPKNDVNDDLAAEVGQDWVIRYDGSISAEVLRSAMSSASALPADARPDLEAREWSRCGDRHREAFVQALAARSSGR